MPPQEHHLNVNRTARYYTIGDLENKPNEVWFVLHGHMYLAKQFIRYFRVLETDRRLIVAPEGLSRSYVNHKERRVGASWMTKEDRLNEIIARAKAGGGEIVKLMGTSAYYAPASGAVQMAEAIIKDKKRIPPCAAYCDGEYGINGYFVGVPAVLGTGGVERVIEIDLNDQEQGLMDASIDDDEIVVEMADYFSRPLRLTAPEALGILASGKAVQSAGSGGDALDRAIVKLEGMLLPEGADAGVVDIPEPPLVGELRTAATEGSVMQIDHTSVASGAARIRDIEPWAVFTTLGNWYVSGFCRSADAERVFRIDRIRTVTPTGERFTPNPTPHDASIRYTPGDDDVHVTIRLFGDARWVADYYPVDVIDDGPDMMTIQMSVGDAAVAARLLIRLGTTAEVVEGSTAANAAADLRARILERYS